jgi:hypothetical protein
VHCDAAFLRSNLSPLSYGDVDRERIRGLELLPPWKVNTFLNVASYGLRIILGRLKDQSNTC